MLPATMYGNGPLVNFVNVNVDERHKQGLTLHLCQLTDWNFNFNFLLSDSFEKHET